MDAKVQSREEQQIVCSGTGGIEENGFWKKRKTCKVDRCNTRIRLAEEFCDKHKDEP